MGAATGASPASSVKSAQSHSAHYLAHEYGRIEIMHGYHVTWSLNQKRTETFMVAPNPAAAATALRASLGGMPVVILAMRASHPGMPRWIGAPIITGV